MMPRFAKLPTKIVFPFGYTITVRQIPEEGWTEPNADSGWYSEHRLIIIRKSLNPMRKRYLLTHEMAHGWIDWQHYCLDRGIGAN